MDQYTWVAFWERDHWVAGLTDRAIMVEGRTLKGAVDKLRTHIKPGQLLNRQPYAGCDLRGDERPFADAYWLVDDGGERYETEPSKTTRYAGTFDGFQLLTEAWLECSDEDRQTVLSELLTRARNFNEDLNESLSIATYRLVAVMQNIPKS